MKKFLQEFYQDEELGKKRFKYGDQLVSLRMCEDCGAWGGSSRACLSKCLWDRATAAVWVPAGEL